MKQKASYNKSKENINTKKMILKVTKTSKHIKQQKVKIEKF